MFNDHAYNINASHPTRVRGLKQTSKLSLLACLVAPHTGAWIETTMPRNLTDKLPSHPTRVRGLKHL